MTVHRRLALAVALASVVAVAPAAAAQATAAQATAAPATPGGAPATLQPACAPAQFGYERCLVLFRPQFSVNRAIAAGVTGAAATPQGWGPRQLERAYKLPVKRHSHQIVAVSIAFDTPQLAHYLAVYRAHYGLPP